MNLFKDSIAKLKIFYLIFSICFFLSGCGCECNKIQNPNSSDYSTAGPYSVMVYADACAPNNGRTITEGYSYSSSVPVPNAKCDTWDGGSYKNRGRWVQMPNLGVGPNSKIQLSTYGSIFYCSSGYDNVNISPILAATPGTAINQTFSNKTTMPIEKGQLVVLNIADTTGNGIAQLVTNSNAALSLPTCSSSQYTDFQNGKCRATGGFGLSIYLDENEVVTLDNTDYTGSKSFYTLATSRSPYLYSPTIPSSQLTTFYNQVKSTFGQDVSGANANQYIFVAPYSGILGINMAEGVNTGTPGYGEWNITVLTNPPSCFVENSIAYNEGNRGALMVIFGESQFNPNTYDTVLATFQNYDPSLSIYYPELMQYIGNKIGVEVSDAPSALNDLLVPATGTTDDSATGTPSLYPTYIVTTQDATLSSSISGNIWFKIMDDYYNDNVGAYQVNVTVQTPQDSQVSSFLDTLFTPILNSLEQTTEAIYNSFAKDNDFRDIMHMCLVLYIIIFGAQYILGLNSSSAQDVVIRVIKIGMVVELFSSGSWSYFNKYFFSIFIQGQSYMITAITGDDSQYYQGVFGFIDDIFNIFFSAYTWQQLAALLPSIIGVLYAFIFINVIVVYLVIISQVMMIYLLAMIGLALLISLAPMFMVTLLFERTKKIFHNWVRYIFDYSVQPVILFAVLFFVNEIFMTLWNSAMSFEICWGGVWTLYFYGVYIWTYQIVQPFVIGCVQYYGIIGGIGSIIVQLFVEIMMLYFFIYIAKAVIGLTPAVTEKLTGASGSATSLANMGAKIVASVGYAAQGGNPMKQSQQRQALSNRKGAEQSFAAKMDKRLGRNKPTEETSNNSDKPKEEKTQNNNSDNSKSTSNLNPPGTES